jgi:hypothetical protein
MELRATDSGLINGYQETVDIEDSYVFPLLKSSAIKTCLISDTSKKVIVTQQKVNAETDTIRMTAPRTWDYLQIHANDFIDRKSSIYKNAPMFSMFGVGDYSYAPYKVGISGFYKNPQFALVYDNDDKPVMLDDTCYFLAFANRMDAYVVMLLLNSPLVQGFLKKISFVDSKRPYTKKVLQRIEFSKCLQRLSIADLQAVENNLGLPNEIKQLHIDSFSELLGARSGYTKNRQLAMTL